jgi:hypothetical protein
MKLLLVISPEVRHIARKLHIGRNYVKPDAFMESNLSKNNTLNNPSEEVNKKRESEYQNVVKNHIENIIGYIQEKEEVAREEKSLK